MTRVATIKRKNNIITTSRSESRGETTLELDLEKCQGCNLCWTVCPRYAIERGPIGASLRGLTSAPPIRIDYHKCIFCGLCAYICPFDALTLKINGQPKEKIIRGISLPFLEGEIISCKRTGNQVLKFLDGDITINDDLCPSGCSTCIDICPVECLRLPVAKKPTPWAKTKKIAVNRDECLYCGACVFACPSEGAIELQRKEIIHGKEGAESKIWLNIEQKLLKPVVSREWFKEERVQTAPEGDKKLPPERKNLKQ